VLEAIRRNSRSTIIYVLFGVLIAVFIINFGPGARRAGERELAGTWAVKVAGSTVSEQDYRLAYIALGGPNIPLQVARERHLKEFVMDKLIERELLAREAERLGFDVSQKEVEDLAADGKMYILGVPRKSEEWIVDGRFNYDRFRAVCQNRLGVTVARFIESQRREMLADKVKQLMLGTVKVTPDEVKADYDQRELQVNLEFVRLQARQFDDKVTITPAEVDAYKKAHADEIQKHYDERAFLYKKLDKQVHLRRILVDVKKDAPEAQVEAAKKKIDAAAARVRKGEDFAQVARQVSEDFSRGRGGDAGWRKKEQTGLRPESDGKVFAAKAGDIIGPERSDRGFELLKVEGFREGDVPLEQVSGEIAEEKLRVEKAKALAKQAAERTLAEVRAGKTLEALYPKPTDADESDPLKKLNAPPTTEDTGLFSRRGEIVPQVGVSAELVKKAFQMKAGELAGPFEVSGAYAVVKLKERKEPDGDFFAKHREEQTRQLERQKWADVLDSWSKARCIEVRDDGRLKVNDDVLAYEGLQEKTVDVKYQPCGNRL
jgi:peptidyl-prolyl cis-trans isomerase D